jgi:predicted RNase H-like nuclease (RuvC/YqgF family)
VQPSFDFLSGWTVLVAAAGALSGYLPAARASRKYGRDALKESAEGWKSLAEVKSQEIDTLKNRLTALETSNGELNSSYRKALEVNLQLQMDLREAQRGLSTLRDIQRELDASRAENIELRERLAETERQIAELQKRATHKKTYAP